MKNGAQAKESQWQKTSFANLVRYKPSGMYFARIRVGGKLIRRTLKTTVLTVAKLRLSDLEKAERTAGTTQKAIQSGKVTMGDVLESFRKVSRENVHLKQTTRKYHTEIFKALLKTWPGFSDIDVRQITDHDCKQWATKVAGKYSPVRYNAMVGVLRHLFNLAIETGAIYQNPATKISRAKVRPGKLTLPSTEQFANFITTIKTAGGRDSKNCADLVCFLAFGGFRKSEAAKVTWGDCNFESGNITVRGDEKTGTKNWETRTVPMTPAMATLLKRIKQDRGQESKETNVMHIRECQKAMDRAAKLVEMVRITHHDLRHLFATNCIESGVDIPTVSRWLGHKDGGALAMKVYGHLRDAHSSAMAQKVTFGLPHMEQPAEDKVPDQPVKAKQAQK